MNNNMLPYATAARGALGLVPHMCFGRDGVTVVQLLTVWVVSHLRIKLFLEGNNVLSFRLWQSEFDMISSVFICDVRLVKIWRNFAFAGLGSKSWGRFEN